MKLIYSQLQKLLPDLNKEPQILRDDLTMIGHFTNFYEKIDDEIVFDMDIKVNRGDCLGYYGLARDLSVYYNIPLVLPETNLPINPSGPPPLEIKSADVIRLQAIKLNQVKNSPSPKWLVKFLQLHDINSINILVDLTNYIMLWWGIPNHTFDATKSSKLIWENNTNQKYTDFTTLDGTTLKLLPENLIITDDHQVLSLSFIGGKNSGVDLNTTETILEMAIYDRARVRVDSRSLKTTTQAATRLEKDLDTDTLPLAFAHLISLIISLTGAEIQSSLFDHYPQSVSPPTINFDPQKPSLVSGINIPTDFALDCLTRLGCIIHNHQITPPSIRKDITLEEDLIEEVIRFWGYDKIPTNQPLTNQEIANITPPVLFLIDKLKDDLVTLGYDEILSWPLVKTPIDKSTAIFTQNSLNADHPVLRQTIIQSLQIQIDQYQRFKLTNPQIFEIGKVFSKNNGEYIEHYALGLYHHSALQLQQDLQKLNLNAAIQDNYAEIILDNLSKPQIYIPQNTNSEAIELTSQIITLDANVNFDSSQDPLQLITDYSAKIDPKILWSIQIVDVYNTRYTFRVSYYNCDDKTAKAIHLKTFDLI